jgi:TPR repeat protein
LIKLFKPTKKIVVFVCFFIGVISMADAQYISSYGRMSADEVPQKTMDALSGDPLAAMSLATYSNIFSSIILWFWEESGRWLIISAENGSEGGHLLLSDRLINYSSNDFESRIRGIFWLYTMVKNGYRLESAEPSLNRLGHTLETAQPPDDSRFPFDNTQLSAALISDYRIGALQGNRRAALILGKYYSEAVNHELSEYWFRVGAQNGCPESMYKLGQIMINKDDELDQVRGRFWLDRSTGNEL